MKQSPFRQQSLEEIRAKQAAKRVRLSQRPIVPKTRKKVRTVPKRDKLPPLKTMRNKCDGLLTPIIRKMYPHCLLSGAPTEVAHHHIKKSESSALRYYIPNLIPLTHKAHQALHAHETVYSSRIVAIKGLDWWHDIEREKRRDVKVDVHWFIENYQRLKAIYDAL